MTDYNALAQRIVAQGVGSMASPSTSDDPIFEIAGDYLRAEQFCNDGRVVLALMEKARQAGFVLYIWNGRVHIGQHDMDYIVVNESLAIAICEACCEVLEESNG